jgi:single-strand DNA-binding protein
MSKRAFNKVIVTGNLTRDPDLKWLPSGKAVCNFSIALNDSYKRDDTWVDTVSYLDIQVFDKRAETCNEYLFKGKQVLVEGKLHQRRWEAKDGTKRSKIDIIASNVMFLGSGKDEKRSDNSGDSQTDFEAAPDTDVPF